MLTISLIINLILVNEVEKAIDQLTLTRQKCIGKTKWNCSVELGIPQDTLFVECCTLLYRAYLIVAKELLLVDPARAAKICQIAQNRAKDGNNERIQRTQHLSLEPQYLS